MRRFLTVSSAAVLTAVVGVSSASAGLTGVNPVSLVTLNASAATAPSAETRAASNIGNNSARLNGKVNPKDRPTTYYFQYGRTEAYGSRTSDTAAGRGQSGVSAAATISGLSSGTTYNFRIVAVSDAGTSYGANRTFTTSGVATPDDPGTPPADPGTPPADPGTPPADPGTPPADPGSTPGGGIISIPGDPGTTPGDPGTTPGDPGTTPDDPGATPGPGTTPGGGTTTPGGGTSTDGTSTPGGGNTDAGPAGQPDTSNQLVIGGQPKKHKKFAVAPTAGRIMVNPPGPTGFQPLVEGVSVPIGSIVDARNGTAAITTQLPGGKKQTAEFWGERFKVRQPKEEGGLTEVRVRDARRDCDGKSISAFDKISTARKKKRRGLWGRDTRGRWRTHGRGSQATTRGTIWFSEERCEGTYTKVIEGSVLVRDHYIKRNIVVDAGESYLAKPHKKYPPSLR